MIGRSPRQQLGTGAEDIAAAFLIRRGLKLVTRNYRCRFGEIDLILRDGDTLVFVEVRMRGRSDFGDAAASITPAKQQRLQRTARHYLAQLPRVPACRFDAVLLETLSEDRVEWLCNIIVE